MTETTVRYRTVSTESPIVMTVTPPAPPVSVPTDTLYFMDADIASTTVSRPTLISWSEIPLDADLRMLDERMYNVGHTRVTLRLWRFVPAFRPGERGRGFDTQYILELSGGGCRRKLLLGCDHERAVALCDRLTLARLSPLHLDDVLADGDLFDA